MTSAKVFMQVVLVLTLVYHISWVGYFSPAESMLRNQVSVGINVPLVGLFHWWTNHFELINVSYTYISLVLLYFSLVLLRFLLGEFIPRRLT